VWGVGTKLGTERGDKKVKKGGKSQWGRRTGGGWVRWKVLSPVKGLEVEDGGKEVDRIDSLSDELVSGSNGWGVIPCSGHKGGG